MEPSWLKNISRYHSDMSLPVGNMTLSFDWVIFAPNIAKVLEDIYLKCSMSTNISNTVYVLQTGSWDMRHFSPRFMMRDRRAAQAIVEATMLYLDFKKFFNSNLFYYYYHLANCY
jgi:hypothetical protein